MKPTGRPSRVLIVEDEAIISMDIKRLLSVSGYIVAAVAATADQTIQAIETSDPDLVLMDIHLKGSMDGIETAMQVRHKFKLPVVFVTAHADKQTLERARQTEPFGYIVKPISALSLTSTIEMALHKHRVERRLEEHRAWLTTVLHNVPNAVVVTDLAGEIQFLNSAAEHLTGLTQSRALGKPVDEVLPLSSGRLAKVASHILDKAEWSSSATFPRDTLLKVPENDHPIPLEGDVVISYAEGEPAGAIFSLRDISRREQEERVLRQEEKMLALGQLTSGIAVDFSSLHHLLNSASSDLVNLAKKLLGEKERTAFLDTADTISRASAMGMLIAGQLSELSTPPSIRATYVSASGVVASVEPLLNKLRGPSLQVDIHLTDESTLVLCHPGRLQMLLMNVFINARERMAGVGRSRISTNTLETRQVQILFELEHVGISSWTPLSFPLQMETPAFSLAIAQALVTAMEGSIAFEALSDTQGRLEILLPLQSVSQHAVEATKRRGVVLIVGSDLEMLSKVEKQLEQIRYSVIRCSSAAEALLLGQLHDGKIDCVIADAGSVAPSQRRKLYSFFVSRNAQMQFIRLLPSPQTDEQGWQALLKFPPESIAERVADMFNIKQRAAKA
jgi:PAS domain S-box-containing protein